MPLGSNLQSAMAASDLHSSPVLRPLHDRPLMLSSSPLPDLYDLIAKKPKAQPLRSGSAAVPIPAGVTKAFTTASEILRAVQTAGNESANIIDEPESHAPTDAKLKSVTRSRKTANATKTSKAPKAPKRVAKTVITLSSDDATPPSPKAASDRGAVEEKKGGASFDRSNDDVESKAQPWKKFKMPVSPAQVPTYGKEVDPKRPFAKAKARKKGEKPEVVSRHFDRKTLEEPGAPVKDATAKCTRACSPDSIKLETAVQRRMDWTPPRPDTLSIQSETFDALAGVFEDEDRGTTGHASQLFKDLRDKYGHMESNLGATAPEKRRTAQPLGKRKAIELISVNEPRISAAIDRTPSPAKEKAPKKKPRTITEVSMAAYQVKPVDPTQDPAKDRSLLDHFNVQRTEDAAKVPKGKAPKVTKRTKKAATKQPELLSPRAAMRRSAAQDFVFGTSSQLAREQSPTFLKELNAALRASNRPSDDDPLTDSSASGGAFSYKKSGRGLWSVSARDDGGKLADIEVIDLVDSPAFPQDHAILDPWKDLPPPGPAASESDEANISLLEIGSRTIPVEECAISQPQNRITINSAASASPGPSELSYPLIEDLLGDEMPPPSNQQQSLEDADQALSPSTANDRSQSRPKYELFTDAKLSKEISRYGFKVVKSRTAMISLLDQCWQSKNQAPGVGALFSTSATAGPRAGKTASETGPSSSTASPTKRPRGRPKKSTVVEATVDPEPNAAPPAKRARGRLKKVAGHDNIDTEVLRSPAQKGSNLDRPVTPTKKRGRPPKDGTANALTPLPKAKAAASFVAEIMDSDLEDSDDEEAEVASPGQLFSPGPVEVSITDDTEVSLNISPSDLQSTVFSHITKAVTSAPRTTDPSNPSWHEKMLMYDPIILEDFTTWLNSGQLTKVGYDDEVGPAEVKKWCESRSICCLWRINVHGKERKRF